jgi:hypothetical protein
MLRWGGIRLGEEYIGHQCTGRETGTGSITVTVRGKSYSLSIDVRAPQRCTSVACERDGQPVEANLTSLPRSATCTIATADEVGDQRPACKVSSDKAQVEQTGTGCDFVVTTPTDGTKVRVYFGAPESGVLGECAFDLQ